MAKAKFRRSNDLSDNRVAIKKIGMDKDNATFFLVNSLRRK